MHDSSLNQTEPVPAALVAFLKGVERRAFVFLWLQSGYPAAAEVALPPTIRAFRAQAGQRPMAEWPGLFWRLLIALPGVGNEGWPPALAFLGDLAPLPRRALLLRLAGGLQEEDAAAAMAVTPEAYEQLLADACPRTASGRVDAAAWRRQAEAVQQAARDLPMDQLASLARLREQALTAEPRRLPEPAPTPPVRQAPARRRRWPWIVLAVLACALALLATWYRPWQSVPGLSSEVPADPDDLRVRDPGPITVEALPDTSGPPPAPALPTAMSEAPVDPVAARMDLLSWYAAGALPSRLERESGDAAETAVPPPGAGSEGLQQAWNGLDAIEQAQVREAAVAFAALEPARQLELEATFAGLDGMERIGWRLGPVVGADYPALQPLLGYVPAEERDALLSALRQLGPEGRSQLAVLTQRTPGQERDALRRDLLAQAPGQRNAWLAQRLR